MGPPLLHHHHIVPVPNMSLFFLFYKTQEELCSKLKTSYTYLAFNLYMSFYLKCNTKIRKPLQALLVKEEMLELSFPVIS